MPKQLAPIGSHDEEKHYHCAQSGIKCGEIKRPRPRMVNTYLRNWKLPVRQNECLLCRLFQVQAPL